MSEKKSNIKKRNWAFVMYPESAPSDWKEQLQLTGLQCAVSPLHDSDINADESQKKPHWHVILCYSTGGTTYNVVERLTKSLNGTIPQPLEQLKGYYRYLTHKDNPEKTQYNEADIVTINGFSIRYYVEMTRNEITKEKREIMLFIETHDIREYRDLLLDLDKYEMFDTWEVAANNTIFADSYIRSRRNKLEKLEQNSTH